MRSHLVPCAMNWLHTITLMALIGLLSWGVAHALFGPRITAVLILIAVIGIMLRVRGGRAALRRRMGGRRLAADELEAFHEMVAGLARRAGLRRPPELWYTPSGVPNAHAVGTRRRSAIAISDGLIHALEPREIAGVIAHEIAHIAHGDLWIMQTAEAMSRALSWILRLAKFFLLLAFPFVLSGAVPFSWKVPAIVFGYQFLMMALVSAVSRVREFEADRGAAAIVEDPAAVLATLERMGRIAPARLRDRLWPFSLFNSHPTPAERIARLRRVIPVDRNVQVLSVSGESRMSTSTRVAHGEARARIASTKAQAMEDPIPDECPF